MNTNQPIESIERERLTFSEASPTVQELFALVKKEEGLTVTEASPAVQELFALAKQEAWKFSVLGQAPMPNQPVRLLDWLIVPAEQDSSYIPARAAERAQAILESGIDIQGFVIVHEAPMQLPAPPQKRGNSLEEIDWEEVRVAAGKGLLSVAKIIGAVAVGLVGVVATTLFVGLAALDPILIAVTKDGVWVEIDRWYV